MALDKRVALVTGGSRGLGRGIVIALANAGFDVAFTYNTDIEAAELVIKETRHVKGKILAFQMNVGSRSSIRTTIESITREYRGINILVNNAGIAQEKPFETITDDDWENMLNINLQGPFSLIQEVIPSMVASKWGRIIDISSIGGQ